MQIRVLILFVLITSALSAQTSDSVWVKVANVPVRLSEEVHLVGKVEQNAKAKIKFAIINDSIVPLIIKDVTTSCGCTTSAFTKKPIGKGEQGMVKLTFDTKALGTFSKSGFIYTNFSGRPIKVQIVGEVVADGSLSETENNKTEININSNSNN